MRNVTPSSLERALLNILFVFTFMLFLGSSKEAVSQTTLAGNWTITGAGLSSIYNIQLPLPLLTVKIIQNGNDFEVYSVASFPLTALGCPNATLSTTDLLVKLSPVNATTFLATTYFYIPGPCTYGQIASYQISIANAAADLSTVTTCKVDAQTDCVVWTRATEAMPTPTVTPTPETDLSESYTPEAPTVRVFNNRSARVSFKAVANAKAYIVQLRRRDSGRKVTIINRRTTKTAVLFANLRRNSAYTTRIQVVYEESDDETEELKTKFSQFSAFTVK
jgi:hypothetical protein